MGVTFYYLVADGFHIAALIRLTFPPVFLPGDDNEDDKIMYVAVTVLLAIVGSVFVLRVRDYYDRIINWGGKIL